MKNTSNTQIDGRFAGILGTEYGKLLLAMPHYPLIQNGVAKLVQQSLASAKIKKPSEILELGCGTGLTTIALCETVSHTSITAVDKEITMLKQYEKLVKELRGDLDSRNITIKTVQSDALEFLKHCDDSSFDIVVTAFVLHNLPKALRAEILKEVYRVLRLGGRFVNGDKIAPDNINLHNKYLMTQIAKFVHTYTSPEDYAYCIGWIEHYAVDNHPDLRYTESEVLSSLKAIGFSEVKITGRHWMEAIMSADKK